MTANGQQRRELFLTAADLPPAEREAFVRRNCEDDALCAEVLELLALEPPETFLSPPDLANDVRLCSVFGPYVVEARGDLGPGRHLARHATRGTRAEIELVPLNDDESDDRIHAFVRTAHRMNELRQPAHVPVLEHGRVANAFWFARNRVAGHDLATELDHHARSAAGQTDRAALLPHAGSRAWLHAVLDAFGTVVALLHTAHVAGIAHGDLTSLRILLDDRGQCYVTGFGVASVLGRTATPADDVAAAGALLFTTLLGGVADPPTNPHVHAPPAHERAAALALVRRLDPAARRPYDDAASLLADLRRVRGGQAPAAHRWSERLRSWFRTGPSRAADHGGPSAHR